MLTNSPEEEIWLDLAVRLRLLKELNTLSLFPPFLQARQLCYFLFALQYAKSFLKGVYS